MEERSVQWYYADRGIRFGPVDAVRINELLHAGIITSETLVWHSEMSGWKPLAQSELANLRQSAELPPLPSDRELSNSYPRREMPEGKESMAKDETINNCYLWMLACSPLLYWGCLILIGRLPLGIIFVLLPLIVPLALFTLDSLEIGKHAHPFRMAYLWILFMPLIYIILRCRDTHIGYAPAWLNVGLCLLPLLSSLISFLFSMV